MSGEHVRGRAAGLMALPAGDAERDAALRHAQGCPACAREFEEARRLLEALDALPAPAPPSPELLGTIEASILRDLPPAKATLGLGPWAALVAGWAIFATLAKQHAGDLESWLVSAAALLVAAVALRVASRSGWLAVAAAGVASGALAAWAGSGGGLVPLVGIKCVVIELIAASLPYALVFRAARRGVVQGTPARLSATAAAGALAGHAALHVTCPARAASAHLLVFHLGGVLLAGLLGALLSGRATERATL